MYCRSRCHLSIHFGTRRLHYNALHKSWQEGQQLQLKEFLASEKILRLRLLQLAHSSTVVYKLTIIFTATTVDVRNINTNVDIWHVFKKISTCGLGLVTSIRRAISKAGNSADSSTLASNIYAKYINGFRECFLGSKKCNGCRGITKIP